MEDAELNAIRAARLQELQKNAGKSSNDTPTNAALDQILDPEARARLSRVNLVRPDRAQAVEQYIVKLAQSGQIRRKLTEKDVVEILDGLSRDENKRNENKIVFSRKNVIDDDDDDFFD